MKVPLRGRGGKQDELNESKSAFSLHSPVIGLNFPLPVRVRAVTGVPHHLCMCKHQLRPAAVSLPLKIDSM